MSGVSELARLHVFVTARPTLGGLSDEQIDLLDKIVRMHKTSDDKLKAADIRRRHNETTGEKRTAADFNVILYRPDLFVKSNETPPSFELTKDLWDLYHPATPTKSSQKPSTPPPSLSGLSLNNSSDQASSNKKTSKSSSSGQSSGSSGQSSGSNSSKQSSSPSPLSAAPSTLFPGRFQNHYALCIGNDDYQRPHELDEAVKGARKVAAHLRAAIPGFKDTVTLQENLTKKHMTTVLNKDWIPLQDGTIDENTLFVVYYAGHAEYHGRTLYLIPCDSKLKESHDMVPVSV